MDTPLPLESEEVANARQRVGRGSKVELTWLGALDRPYVVWTKCETPGAPINAEGEVEYYAKLCVDNEDVIGNPINNTLEIRESGFKLIDRYVYRRYPIAMIDSVAHYIDLSGYIPMLKPVVYPMPLMAACIFDIDPINNTSTYEGTVTLLSANEEIAISVSGIDRLNLVKNHKSDEIVHFPVDPRFLWFELKKLPEPPSMCSIM